MIPVFLSPTHPRTDIVPPACNDYHWTPAAQRLFLENLACCGSVVQSAKLADKSGRAAQKFRNRAAGAAFSLGWSAAQLIARRVLADGLIDRAINGQTEIIERNPDTHKLERSRHDNRLGMSMLARLDAIATGLNEGPVDAFAVHAIAQDFEAFLDLIEKGGGGAEAALFVAARNLDPAADEDDIGPCELSRESVTAEDKPEAPPDQVAAAMSVWWCDDSDAYRTDFPPPRDFYGEEDGKFGDEDYTRDLDADETEAMERADAERAEPLRCAGEAARLRFFAFEPPVPEEEQLLLLLPEPVSATQPCAVPGAVEEDEQWATPAFDDNVAGQAEATDAETDKPAPSPYRVLRPDPQPDYAALGQISPWAQRIW